MSISNSVENSILNLIFCATAWANMADNAASSPQTNIGMSLHTQDPLDTGDATTFEVAYTSYTRVNVVRTTTGWPASTVGSISPAAPIDFPQSGSGTGTATHGAAAKSNATPPTGAQIIHMYGTLTPNISTQTGSTPRISTASAFTFD